VVDECHHVSAASFERVARRSKARYVLGLSATVTRKDGHQPIIFMQCGPVRHRVQARALESAQGRVHRVWLRETAFIAPPNANEARLAMPVLYAKLASDDVRNSLIFEDVLAALEEGRCPVVLTERRDHLELLRVKFEKFTKHLVVLRGGLSRRERQAAHDALAGAGDEERLVLATGRCLGEGFDDARLDTLFLVMPIAWRGTLAQYVGRLHRAHHGKTEARVYDYVDGAVPVLARMAAKRQAGLSRTGVLDRGAESAGERSDRSAAMSAVSGYDAERSIIALTQVRRSRVRRSSSKPAFVASTSSGMANSSRRGSTREASSAQANCNSILSRSNLSEIRPDKGAARRGKRIRRGHLRERHQLVADHVVHGGFRAVPGLDIVVRPAAVGPDLLGRGQRPINRVYAATSPAAIAVLRDPPSCA
jgi:superfamily II DNA or RNA helicase